MANDQEELNEETTFAKEALQCEIGAKLQRAREEKNLSIDDILSELKLSKTFLNALETGNWAELPGEVYALGFLKQYASLLNVDVSHEVERIKSNTYELNTPLTYPDQPISPNRTWGVAAILLFILTILVVNTIDNTGKEKGEEASQKSDSERSEQVIIAPKDAQVDLYTTSTPYNEALKTKSIMSPPSKVKDAETLESSSPPTESEIPQPSKAEVSATTKLKKETYTFHAANGDVWLQVYKKQAGQEATLLREVLLKKGQHFDIDNVDAELLLTAGNATALEVMLNNETIYAAGTLGEEGKVLKKQAITSQ